MVERSKSEGAMVHGYLVVKEGGRVERAPIEGDHGGNQQESEASATKKAAEPHHHHEARVAFAQKTNVTMSNFDKLKRSAMSNYFDFTVQPFPQATSGRARRSLSNSSPAAAAPPQSCLSPRNYSGFTADRDAHLPETNLYATPMNSASSLSLGSSDSEEEDGEDGGHDKPAEEQQKSAYEADMLLFPSNPGTPRDGPPAVIFAEGELGGYDTDNDGDDGDGLTTSGESSSTSSDEDEGSDDADYEMPGEDEEWDTSEEEEMERVLRSIDRGDLRCSSNSIWNQRFQDLVRLKDDENKYQQLAYLAHDFQHAAEVYGRTPLSLSLSVGQLM
jgi:hypothetical protein